ncbi:hypothetical protein T05_13906 [Trichinella murrelli]|uniref:Uncharacterized protein n=1 Tax=Trichinella murrelli TaxID=144512 RepID=A0A0V0TPV0_9BILA|nr:hypothetical protein T05_13906 [Trichinella murrelli]
MNSQLISNSFAHGWYLFETLENSTSMYNGNYSWHLKNDCVLASNFVPIQVGKNRILCFIFLRTSQEISKYEGNGYVYYS